MSLLGSCPLDLKSDSSYQTVRKPDCTNEQNCHFYTSIGNDMFSCNPYILNNSTII